LLNETTNMKYVIIIPDGAADTPIPDLHHKTPLDVANNPNIDWVATHGKPGTIRIRVLQ